MLDNVRRDHEVELAAPSDRVHEAAALPDVVDFLDEADLVLGDAV